MTISNKTEDRVMRHSSKQSRWGHDLLLLAVFAAAMGLVLTSTSNRADPIVQVDDRLQPTVPNK